MSRIGNDGIGNSGIDTHFEGHAEGQARNIPLDEQPRVTSGKSSNGSSPDANPIHYATRLDPRGSEGIDRKKLLLLGGALGVAVLFFVFTAVLGRSPGKGSTEKRAMQETSVKKASVTPLMDTVRTPAQDDTNGQLKPGDIKRTRSTAGQSSANLAKTSSPSKLALSDSLGSVPSFSETQQKWEEPRPYAQPEVSSSGQTQQQNALKEPSLIFVRSQTSNQTHGEVSKLIGSEDAPQLEMAPGSRIQAKLETQISSAVQAPVVAVVEYTYAIGDRIVVPAGARIYGQFQQADRNGNVSVKFDEIELLDGVRERIEAVGAGLDLGPIKGTVSGKNTGRNFLVHQFKLL